MLRNLELMPSLRLAHGDLSAYNIPYWEGEITLIEFPQVVDIDVNRAARRILARAMQRISDYSRRQGVECDADALAADLWARHGTERDPALKELA